MFLQIVTFVRVQENRSILSVFSAPGLPFHQQVWSNSHKGDKTRCSSNIGIYRRILYCAAVRAHRIMQETIFHCASLSRTISMLWLGSRVDADSYELFSLCELYMSSCLSLSLAL